MSVEEYLKRYMNRRDADGRNRRAYQKGQGSTTDEPDSCARGTSSQRAVTGTSRTSKGSRKGTGRIDLIDLKVVDNWVLFNTYSTSWSGADETEMELRKRNGKWAPPWMSGELGKPNDARAWVPRSVKGIKSEGIVAGEIIAWRAWHWNGKRLRSIFVDYEWPIGKPALGQPGKGYGIHAFKSPKRAYQEYWPCINDVLIGQVALWGDVIEFEEGYTAEYARVLTLLDAPELVKQLYEIET